MSDIELVEGSEIVVSEAPKQVAVMSEKKALACAEKVRKGLGSVYENLRLLAEGQGWIALGYENWDDMCYGEFGYASSSARRIRAMAFLQHKVAGLLESDNAKSILNRMPEDAVKEFENLVKNDNAPEVVTRIMEDFASENVIPTVEQVLEAIGEKGMLTDKQIAKLAKLQEDDSAIVDYAAKAEGLIETINRAFEQIANHGLYGNLDYPDFYSLVRDRFSNLRNAFVDENGDLIPEADDYGSEFDTPTQVDYDPTDDEPEQESYIEQE